MNESSEATKDAVREILDRISGTAAMKKTMNDFLGATEKGENPKERLGRLKPDLSLIPQSVLVLEAMAMMQGAEKYGPYNWRSTKVQARTYIAAAQRHLAAWLDGEEVAEDSGIHHLAHARASLGVVMDAQLCGMMVDDRPRKGFAGNLIEAYSTRNDPAVGISAKTPGLDGPDLHSRLAHRLNNLGGISAKIPEGEPTSVPGLTAPTFYVAGPMRGIDNFNFPAFDAARDLGNRLGFSIISPADMDRKSDVHEDTNIAEIDVRTFVERDVNALLSLIPERRDGIALLPGWEGSTGALAELFIARWLGLRIVSAITFEEFTGGSPADIIAEGIPNGKFGGGI